MAGTIIGDGTAQFERMHKTYPNLPARIVTWKDTVGTRVWWNSKSQQRVVEGVIRSLIIPRQAGAPPDFYIVTNDGIRRKKLADLGWFRKVPTLTMKRAQTKQELARAQKELNRLVVKTLAYASAYGAPVPTLNGPISKEAARRKLAAYNKKYPKAFAANAALVNKRLKKAFKQ